MTVSQRGLLIVFEGCDRCGKSTQSKLLLNYLASKGYAAKHRTFPDRTTGIGQMISAYLSNAKSLSDQAVHLLFSANRWECADDLKKELESGTTVIVDRYAYSGVAFSSAKGMDFTWCKTPDIGLPKPDKVFYLDLRPELAQKRGGYGNERYEKLEFQSQVYRAYEQLKDDSWTVIDADRSQDVIQEELQTLVSEELTKAGTSLKPLEKLWQT